MWGEIAQNPDGARIFYEELSKEQVLDLYNLMEQAQQPNCLSNYNISPLNQGTKEVTLQPMDPTMIYTASLHNCTNKMETVINDALLALEFNITMPSQLPTIKIPEPIPYTPAAEKNSLNFIEKRHSNFTMGFGKDPPTLCDATRQHIETKCVATLLAQSGFEKADLTVLNSLTDVLESFFKNICKELKIAQDAIFTGEGNNFADIVDQVLVQSGLGGIKGIHEYYHTRVKLYEKRVERRHKKTLHTYHNLYIPTRLQKIKSEKVDESLDEENIPEVHFATMEGEESLQPFLAGLQMLNSLEQESEYVS